MRGDWVSPWWQAAVLPERFRVGPVRAPALTVWHEFALGEIRNPYMVGGTVTINDIAGLLLIVSRDRAAGRRLILGPNHRAREQRRMMRRLRRYPFERLHAACEDYVTTCTRGASRWRKGGEKPCAVPYAWHIVARLGERAWEMPYAVARCLCDALAEQNGDDSLLSPAAQEMEDNWHLYAGDGADASSDQKAGAA
jgi:hypothetical protein